MEELENLEETLNDSIRESLGARSGIRSRGKKGGGMEDEEELLRYVPKDECGMRGGGVFLCVASAILLFVGVRGLLVCLVTMASLVGGGEVV